VTEPPGRPVLGPPPDDAPPGANAPLADASYARPDGVTGSFAANDRPEPPYLPPPPTVSPEQRAAFERPAGAAPFDAPPGTRIGPRPPDIPAVAPFLADAFHRPPTTTDGFDPAPGSRIVATGPAPESPWWQPGARHDPWRNPQTPFWLGRGAVFSKGAAQQLDALDDEAQDEDDAPPPAEDPETEEPAGRPPRGRLGLRVLTFGVFLTLLAGAIGGGIGYWLAQRGRDVLLHHDVSLPQNDTPANRPPGSIAAIAKRVGPAVVSIAVTTPDEYAVGSGVVIDKDGDVLTNNHVIAPALTSSKSTIVVTFSNEDTATATIVGRDQVSDLAVLNVPTDNLTVATLGNSDSLEVGDPVIAIGSPLGLTGTVTSGIVSALNRAVHVFGDDGSSDAYLDAIQTDAPINPGNSGGALVDAAGAVVGINSAAALASTTVNGQQTPASGIGYAIPIDYARSIALQLIKTGHARHGSLGAQGRTATAGLQEGAYLEQVVPKGPAAKAGLRNGDVIVAANGVSILSYDQLAVAVSQRNPGDRLSLTYFRGAGKHTTTVTLGGS
jgi:S1-C subfamily serine protease